MARLPRRTSPEAVWDNAIRPDSILAWSLLRTTQLQLNPSRHSQELNRPVSVLATAQDLARTYPPVNEVSAWSRVQEYRRVQEFTAQNPDKGSQAVSTALNLPRGRIRTWVDGEGMPDPARAIDRARTRGWLDLDADDAHPWVRLVAWIFSGGSISRDTFEPLFFVRDRMTGLDRNELDVLRGALDDIGTGHQLVDRDISDRATHIGPAEDAVLVGRLLAAMGAPVGEKHAEMNIALPDWLSESSLETKRAFARIYILNRGTLRDHEPIWHLREQRPEEYHEEIVELFRTASGLDDGVTWGGHNVRLRSEVVDALLDD